MPPYYIHISNPQVSISIYGYLVKFRNYQQILSFIDRIDLKLNFYFLISILAATKLMLPARNHSNFCNIGKFIKSVFIF